MCNWVFYRRTNMALYSNGDVEMNNQTACEFDLFSLSSEIECLLEFDDDTLKANAKDLRECADKLNKLLERIDA